MKSIIIAAVALVAGVAVGVPAVALGEDGSASTYGGYQVITIEEETSIVSGSATTDAACPDESWALTGGGFFTNNFQARIIDNRNIDPATGPSYWHVTATVEGTTSANFGTLIARAICTKLG